MILNILAFIGFWSAIVMLLLAAAELQKWRIRLREERLNRELADPRIISKAVWSFAISIDIHDIWVGMYWKYERGKEDRLEHAVTFYICLVPILVIRARRSYYLLDSATLMQNYQSQVRVPEIKITVNDLATEQLSAAKITLQGLHLLAKDKPVELPELNLQLPPPEVARWQFLNDPYCLLCKDQKNMHGEGGEAEYDGKPCPGRYSL